MKSEKITIDGTDYTVKEMSMRDAMPVLEAEPKNMALEIMKLCVTKNGKLLGDSLLDMGFSSFQKLLKVSNRINGFSAGND